MRVEDREVDPGHDAYLAVIVAHTDPVGDAMIAMARASRVAGGSLRKEDVAAAAELMENVGSSASDFLRALEDAHCPTYLRGANDQLEDALRRIVRGSQHAAAAASAGDGAQVFAAGTDMNTANEDIVAAAQRIADWRSGAARP